MKDCSNIVRLLKHVAAAHRTAPHINAQHHTAIIWTATHRNAAPHQTAAHHIITQRVMYCPIKVIFWIEWRNLIYFYSVAKHFGRADKLEILGGTNSSRQHGVLIFRK
ncbi:hypothetical protein PoB_006812100 [Plakobranchus ocellatus]|uniref:Uncharacterized protein n=1 Tax=Plakobranchus ocellatus TaxID=259542 RepID=A0AAV4DC21_9GAST|nr:hypothetical protein PoB_006812100 [Plakobranchus ocellatus]